MIFRLSTDSSSRFPDVALAEEEPNGLLAVGGDLSPERLINAYHQGIFPWFSEGDPILWWSPEPRMVLYPHKIKISRSLRKSLRKASFQVTFDRAFSQVIQACAAPRADALGTWLVADMITAYQRLYELNYAHSVEVWQDQALVGGLYGIAIGAVFYGESMFNKVSDSSKVALVYLAHTLEKYGFKLIDCQVYTQHLVSLGAEEISRAQFCQHLDDWCTLPGLPGSWETRMPQNPLSEE